MVLDINVTGARAAASRPGRPGRLHRVPRSTSRAKPGADWQAYDPALEPAPGGTERQIEFRATETVLEVESTSLGRWADQSTPKSWKTGPSSGSGIAAR